MFDKQTQDCFDRLFSHVSILACLVDDLKPFIESEDGWECLLDADASVAGLRDELERTYNKEVRYKRQSHV